jgi:hypothetical protein
VGLACRQVLRIELTKDLGTTLGRWLVLKEKELARAAKAAAKAGKAAKAKFKNPLVPGKSRGRKSSYKLSEDDWSSSDCVVAGDWMLRIALRLPCFAQDENGQLGIAPGWSDRIDKICEELQWRHPVMLPHLEPPKPATEWWTDYSDRLRVPFVRADSDWRPETREAVEATFEAAKPPTEPLGSFGGPASMPFLHAEGISALKTVPLCINQALLPLVDKFAVEAMGHGGKQRDADRRTVDADLRHARLCGDQTVFLDYSCDWRGRIYAVQPLNYAREDHVRALFKFARGEPLGPDGLSWLEIHAANCYGEVDKELECAPGAGQVEVSDLTG